MKVDDLRPLTSLRFFAAVAIVLFHAISAFEWPWLSYVPRSAGHAVSFFFVLSGFILTHVYSARGIESYGTFLRTRVARIWPTHITVLLLLVAFVPPSEVALRAQFPFDLWTTGIANALMLQSGIPSDAFFYSWNAPSWSISTEFFFYLIFPFLLPLVWRRWQLPLLFSIVLVIGTIAIGQKSFIYTFPTSRMFEFILGMSAYVLWKRWVEPARLAVPVWTVLEIAGIALCATWLGSAEHFRSLLVPTNQPTLDLWLHLTENAPVFAVVIIVMASGRGLIGRALGLRRLVYLGSISFALYMFHMPVITLLSPVLHRFDTLPATAILFTALGLVSIVSYELIETPAREMIRKRTAGDLPSSNAGTGSLMASVR